MAGDYPWDVRLDKFLRSFGVLGVETTVLSANKNGAPTQGEYLEQD